MSVKFQAHLPTNKDITTSNIVILCWTSLVLCGVLFSNFDPVSIITKARVSDNTELTQRHKTKTLPIMFLS